MFSLLLFSWKVNRKLSNEFVWNLSSDWGGSWTESEFHIRSIFRFIISLFMVWIIFHWMYYCSICDKNAMKIFRILDSDIKNVQQNVKHSWNRLIFELQICWLWCAVAQYAHDLKNQQLNSNKYKCKQKGLLQYFVLQLTDNQFSWPFWFLILFAFTWLNQHNEQNGRCKLNLLMIWLVTALVYDSRNGHLVNDVQVH